jgi:uncharacterized protein DUF429
LIQRPLPLRSAGVDIATGGWAVVVLEGYRVIDVFRCETFADALLVDVEVIGVDIPIGIPDHSPRQADVAARRFVGARGPAVFPTPVRRVLEAPTYAQARAIATELTGKSISAQTYALSPPDTRGRRVRRTRRACNRGSSGGLVSAACPSTAPVKAHELRACGATQTSGRGRDRTPIVGAARQRDRLARRDRCGVDGRPVRTRRSPSASGGS